VSLMGQNYLLKSVILLHYPIAILLPFLPLSFICTDAWDFHLPNPIHLTVLKLAHIYFPIQPLQFTRTLKFSVVPAAYRQTDIKLLSKPQEQCSIHIRKYEHTDYLALCIWYDLVWKPVYPNYSYT
jgi:hypothetical protein